MFLSVKSCFVGGGELCGSSGGRCILNFYYREANLALQFLTWRMQLHRVTKKLKLGPSVLSHDGGECH